MNESYDLQGIADRLPNNQLIKSQALVIMLITSHDDL